MQTAAATLQIRPTPLTREAFAPFGDVIEMQPGGGYAINGGTSWRWDDVAALDLTREGGQPLLSLFRTEPCQLPLTIAFLERHPLSSQAFVPLSQRPFLVVVAPPGEQIKPSDIRAFLTAPGQGVNYAAGVWHHPLLALHSSSDFAVLGRRGPDENCDLHHFDHPITLVQ
ncbi:ureidoglycolate lyase [Agaricicola taiwanensis]|uniref:Ureidoglycolate lyase n=1 Tax=Agaricicola taiwanensis TaxID=591372 RepID=A0A8J2YH70_9RHOB|nr:ureidoglycolate lyase [Agaricicola taiwanensis]GGE41308.1 ureidoglycolate lyase [Agaricicola taiwanensis]